MQLEITSQNINLIFTILQRHTKEIFAPLKYDLIHNFMDRLYSLYSNPNKIEFTTKDLMLS